MTEYLASPLGFTTLAIVASALGAIALAIRPDWVNRHAALFSLAAAGLLIAFVLLDLVPHALAGGALSALFLLGGYLAGLVTSLLTRHDDNQTLDVRTARSGVALAGIGLHAFLDGVVFAVALSGSTSAGLLAAFALALHKVPVSALTFGLLRTAKLSVTTSLVLAVVSCGVFAGLGVYLAQPLIEVAGANGLSALSWPPALRRDRSIAQRGCQASSRSGGGDPERRCRDCTACCVCRTARRP